VRGESACGNLIQMHYGMFDDPRLEIFSRDGESFLKRVNARKMMTDYFMQVYATPAPKFNSRIGEIA